MSVGRYRLSIALMTVAAVCFATLGLIDNAGWWLLAVAAIAWPVRGVIHYGSGR